MNPSCSGRPPWHTKPFETKPRTPTLRSASGRFASSGASTSSRSIGRFGGNGAIVHVPVPPLAQVVAVERADFGGEATACPRSHRSWRSSAPGTNPMANRDYHIMIRGEIVDACLLSLRSAPDVLSARAGGRARLRNGARRKI